MEQPRLSCEQCRRRKTKCDKGAPCSACKAANLRCETVQRARLPRGRSGKAGRNKEALESRIRRIENLLKQRNADVANGDAAEHTAPAPSTGKLGNYVASDFWEALAEEVSGIREVIEDSEGEDELHEQASNLEHGAVTGHYSSPLFIDGVIAHALMMNDTLSAESKDFLLEIYHVRVDTVFKVLHWQATARAIRRSYKDSRTTASSHALKALELATHYMAVCTMFDDECLATLGSEKEVTVQHYRVLVELQLSKAKVLQRPTIIGLQAFVIYLKALRTSQRYASSWTLLSVVVRLASALGLGTEDPGQFSKLDLEIRRRLWYGINVLDIQAMLDRGTPPLIPESALGPMPLEIDDEELITGKSKSFKHGGALDDMAFSMMVFKAMVCQKKICVIFANFSGSSDDGWIQILNLQSELQKSIHEKYLNKSPTSGIQLLLQYSGLAMLATMRLLIRRPPYRQTSLKIPSWDQFDPLPASIEVLERFAAKSCKSLQLWAWKAWPPWYAVAVALAEICRTPHAEGVERAYTLANQLFDRFASPPNDEESGMLWKPIMKLLRRVQQLRKDLPKHCVKLSPHSGVEVETDTNGVQNWFADFDETSWFQADGTWLPPIDTMDDCEIYSLALQDEFDVGYYERTMYQLREKSSYHNDPNFPPTSTTLNNTNNLPFDLATL